MNLFHIACAADNKYAVLAATMLKSIEVSSLPESRFCVWFLDNGITPRRKRMLTDSLNPEKIRIEFVRPSEKELVLLDRLPDGRRLTAYHRLFLPRIVREETEMLLYLDCDILVLRDIEKLISIPLGSGDLVAAARDANAWTVGCDWGGGIPNWEQFGMAKDSSYFNSGVLLIDVEKWIKEQIPKRVIECNASNMDHVVWLDQYGLNVVLHDSWREIPLIWNSYPEKANSESNIIHFVSRKPNEIDYKGRYLDAFHEILDQTAWAGRRPIRFPFHGSIPPRVLGHLKRFFSPW